VLKITVRSTELPVAQPSEQNMIFRRFYGIYGTFGAVRMHAIGILMDK
jgi:hypothetical protein